MRQLTIILIILLIVTASAILGGCNHNVHVNDTRHTIDLTLLAQLTDLCESYVLRSDFETWDLYDQAVSECVLDSLSAIKVIIHTPEDNL